MTRRMRTLFAIYLACTAGSMTVARAADPAAATAAHGRTMQPNSGTANWTTGDYAYDPSGNIVGIGSQVFLYDVTGRLVSSKTLMEVDGQPDVPQTETFDYDEYGNMTGRSVDGITASSPTNPSTNRLTAFSAQFDAAGNLTAMQPAGSVRTYTYDYDSFNQQRDRRSTAPSPGRYTINIYTADDERLWSYDVSANISHWTLRDLSGKVLRDFRNNGDPNLPADAHWSVTRDYVYRDGLLLAAITPTTTENYTLDHLGTPRFVTDSSGARIGRHTYRAFGTERTDPLQEGSALKFTGHERDRDPLPDADPNADLDYMHARYCSANLGRFLSADRVFGRRRTPQSWNRYSYAANNPYRYTDPYGLSIWEWFKGLFNGGCQGPCPIFTMKITVESTPIELSAKEQRMASWGRWIARNNSATQMVRAFDNGDTIGGTFAYWQTTMAPFVVMSMGEGGGSSELVVDEGLEDPIATGFRGSEGFEMSNTTYQPVRNVAGEVDGISYSGHAFDRMQDRGIMPSVVKNTIDVGVEAPSKGGTIAYYDVANNVTVVRNATTGRVVTVRLGTP
jgi:RHS repeat-associated protein